MHSTGTHQYRCVAFKRSATHELFFVAETNPEPPPVQMHRSTALAALLLLSAAPAAALFKRKPVEPIEVDEELTGLLASLGEMVFDYINTPKYRFYFFMLGYSLDKTACVTGIVTLCNFLYCVTILLGFMGIGGIPRTYMLILTLCTVVIGPAIVLAILAAIGIALVCFALYPIASVTLMWVGFFVTSV